MIRSDFPSFDAKRRNVDHPRKKQFAGVPYGHEKYPHRLNIYENPPTAEIELEKFEQWAIDRLRSTWLRFWLTDVIDYA